MGNCSGVDEIEQGIVEDDQIVRINEGPNSSEGSENLYVLLVSNPGEDES